MKIVLFGDSHGEKFRGCGSVQYYRDPAAYTAQRLIQRDPVIWPGLQTFLLSHAAADCAVISVGEVDIRGHFWRHYPRHHHRTTVSEFVYSRAGQLWQCLEELQQQYQWGRVVLWGPPPATANTNYDPGWPFSGAVATRNMLINQWNHCCREFAEKSSSMAYATAYYDHIDSLRHQAVNHAPSDGVHWQDSVSEEFWQRYILPAMQGQNLVLNRTVMDTMNYHYSLEVQTQRSNTLYDSWVAVDHCAGEHCCEFQGQLFEYQKLDRCKQLANYSELGLRADLAA